MNTEKTCTIVLGMHRSGTSMLSGCLHLMGVNLGSAIMAANPENQAGYFENQDIMLAHDILLRDLGCRWDMVGNLPDGWEESAAAKKASETLTGILERQLLNKGPFALKDPRMCRLMPLWMPLFNNLDISPGFIIIVRHPMEVALSLQKRDGFDLLKGHLLWMVHNRDALNACRNHKHMFITFDQLLADPLNTLQKAGELPSVPEFDPQQHTHKLLEFIRPDLKHQHQGVSTETDNQLFQHYAWIYDQFRNMQAQALADMLNNEQGRQDTTIEELSDFPLPLPISSALPAAAARTHATNIFNNLLGIIGSYEQADLDHRIHKERLLLASLNIAETLFLEVFFPSDGPETYSEKTSCKLLLAPEEWQQLSVDIPRPEHLRTLRLRLDPLNTRGMVSISALKLINIVSGDVCWSAEGKFSQCSVEGDGFVLSSKETFEIVCTGNDPRMLLPALPDLPDTPMRLEIWIKASRRQADLKDRWSNLVQSRKKTVAKRDELQKQRDELNTELQKLKQNISDKENSINEKNNELQKLKQNISDKENSINEKNNELQKQLKNQETLTEEYFKSLSQAERELQKLKQNISDKENSINEKNNELQKQKNIIEQYYNALTQAEEEQDKAEKQIRHLEQLAEQKEETISQTKKDLTNKTKSFNTEIQNQKKLTEKYYYALAKTEEEQDYYKVQSRQLKQKNRNLDEFINRLYKEIETLHGSMRWRFGNAAGKIVSTIFLRKTQPLVTDRLEELAVQIKELVRKTDDPGFKYPSKDQSEDIQQLTTWIRQLNNDLIAVKHSLRWKTGNMLFRTLDILTLRGNPPLATDHLESLFRDYDAASKKHPILETHKLDEWLRKIGNDFKALNASKRWKAGNTLFSLIDRLCFRGKKPTAMDHAQAIIRDYEAWKTKHTVSIE